MLDEKSSAAMGWGKDGRDWGAMVLGWSAAIAYVTLSS
jgi:hypothetical protein